ncbi:MAG: hypothetical protein ABGY75_08530 [Gemmataceae bacterium]
MVIPRFPVAVVLLLLVGGGSLAAEPKAAAAGRKPTTPAAPTQPKLLDFVAESHRDVVAAIVKAPTLAAKATEDDFAAHPAVYDFLLAHPDRTSLAWQRLKVPCVEITDLGKGQFFWADEGGSELTWQTVGAFEHGVVWYATGKVKAGTLFPTVPVKAVAVLQSPRTAADADGVSRLKPQVNVYLQCDSKLAAAALRIAGPSAPRMAEEGAEQLLFFFSGVARYLHKKPDQVEVLLAPKGK